MIKKSLKTSSAKKTTSVKSLKAKKTSATKKPATKKPTATKRTPSAKKSSVVKSTKKTTRATAIKRSSVAISKKTTPKKTAAVKSVPKKATSKPITKKSSTKAPAKRTTSSARAKTVESIKSTFTPLIIEPYPKDYTGLPFLTLIQFRRQPMLVIVDNVDDDLIRAYVLDLCGPAHVDEEKIVLTAAEWFSENRSKYPISIEFSKRGMTPEASKIYRTFDIEFVSRVIGPAPEFPMGATKSVRRRRRKPVPPGVEVVRAVGGDVDNFFTS